MARHTLVTIDSKTTRVIKSQPLIMLHEKGLYVLDENLLNDIRLQIGSAINATNCYTTVGYIQDGKVHVNSDKDLYFNIYDLRQFMWE